MKIIVAQAKHIKYATKISSLIQESAKSRGTGIALRTPEYIAKRIENSNAIIALDNEQLAGFCYIESWGHGKYVAHSGLIVHPDYRGKGLAYKIKKRVFKLSLKKYPKAKIFGITTSKPVMKINHQLGYKPVHFSDLTDDPEFWNGCRTCNNYDVLTRTQRKMCLCTGMLFDPKDSNLVGKVKTKLKSI